MPERGSERRSPRLPAFCRSQPGLQPSLPPQHTSLGTGLQIHSNPATHTHTQRAPATCHRRQDTSNPHSDRLSPCVNSCTISTASLVTTLTESEWISVSLSAGQAGKQTSLRKFHFVTFVWGRNRNQFFKPSCLDCHRQHVSALLLALASSPRPGAGVRQC